MPSSEQEWKKDFESFPTETLVELLDNVYRYGYRRQMLTPAYHPNGAVIVVKRDVLMSDSDSDIPDRFLGKKRFAIIQEPEDTVDVDEPIDILWAEFLMDRR